MTEANPILLLASGQRTGSTLLQRFMLSHPRLMLWGEHDGVLADVMRRYERLYAWDGMFAHHLQTFQTDGYNNFIPNMIPPRTTIDDSLRALFHTLYRDPAAAMGRDLWGFKEVLYTVDDALRFRALFPSVKVVFITRNPFDCFVSLLHEERQKPHEVTIPLSDIWTRTKTIAWVETWTTINRSFLEHDAVSPEWVYTMTYEQLIADPAHATRALAAWLGLAHEDFDLDVFNHRIYTDRNNQQANRRDTRPKIRWDDLTAEEYRLMTQPELVHISRRLGYDRPIGS